MIRLAFLGCGAIAARHAKTIRKVRPDVDLSFGSRDRAKAEDYARRFGGRAFGSYEDALRDEDVDVAFVVLPPALHLEWSKRALDAKKHVMVEKPPYRTVAELDQVARRASEVGRRVMVAENYFYKPVTRRVRALISEGAIGEVLFLHVNALKTQPVTGWREDEGALLEGGIHWIDFMSNIGLTVRSAHGHRPGDRDGVDRSMLISFEYEEGAVGSLYYSWEVPSLLNGIRLSRIYGREGTLTFESNGAFVFVQGKRLALSIAPGLSDAGGFGAMFSDFFRALEEDREPALSLEKARRDLALIEGIQRDAPKGETRAA
jgi:predicted dehydrogenase